MRNWYERKYQIKEIPWIQNFQMKPVGWVEPLAKPNFDFVGFPSSTQPTDFNLTKKMGDETLSNRPCYCGSTNIFHRIIVLRLICKIKNRPHLNPPLKGEELKKRRSWN